MSTKLQPVKDMDPEKQAFVEAKTRQLIRNAHRSEEEYMSLIFAAAYVLAEHSLLPGAFSLDDLMGNIAEQVDGDRDLMIAHREKTAGRMN